jgi:hypothetical protein
VSGAARAGPKMRRARFDAQLASAARVMAFALPCAWLGHGAAARAAVTSNVLLSVTGCTDAQVPADRLFDLVRTEVSPFNLAVAGASFSGDCSGLIALCYGSPDRVWMALSGAQGNVERVVELSDVAGELRIRTLAVTFAEMLTTLQSRVLPAASPANAMPSAPANPISEPHLAHVRTDIQAQRNVAQRPAAKERASRSSRMSIGAGGTLRQFATPNTLLAGPWLAIAWGSWEAEALYLQASRQVAAGSVQLQELNLAAVYVPLQLGEVPRILLGIRGEIGMNWASGSPDTHRNAVGTTERRLDAALLAEPRLELALSTTIVVQARLAAGVAYGPTARANGAPALTSGGAFAGASLGCGARF